METEKTDDTHPLGGTFKFRMWVTRGCFFVFSDRLKRKARYSVGAITVLSFYVLTVSIIAIIFNNKFSSLDEAVLSTSSIVLSVLIIIVTLLENSKDYGVKAEQAFQTAHALENLYNRYEVFSSAGGERDTQAEMEFRDEYNEILRNARLSRKAVDYHLFQVQNVAAFRIERWRVCAIFALATLEMLFEYWLYAAMIAMPPLAAAGIFMVRFGP